MPMATIPGRTDIRTEALHNARRSTTRDDSVLYGLDCMLTLIQINGRLLSGDRSEAEQRSIRYARLDGSRPQQHW